MKILRIFFLLIFVLSAPSIIRAQGVPKAYEAFDYSGTVNGKVVRFSLADGYIGASYLHMYLTGKAKPVYFQPDVGIADEHNKLKFVPFPKGRSGYFILDNIQEAYDKNPAYIVGNYYLNHKVFPVKFRLIKHSGATH
ncbi:hypothetical protein SAMN05421821_102107 [Mucilaginibacter lappiensis]|uniref:Uncharacterized protein n=1 Tax=Mucilaginibacter lappiensis TaxID=354630 RepID=A0ABR6PGD0_9SPHI|nr:hypothetical protein [Mucilaginibacter lappiensis]MBB6108658.1 hypothetical protein [Mucilaginibacter lappiensis]SIQ28998.1 hypothetical protein SAMN05421821_102107 [Mucilaginibacter lappiensis]